MNIKATPLGKKYPIRESDILSMEWNGYGQFKVIVELYLEGGAFLIQYTFNPLINGIRMLNEQDLIGYWSSGAFGKGYVLYQVSGGWNHGDPDPKGNMFFIKTHKDPEYFIATSNYSVSVLSSNPPLIEELGYDNEEPSQSED